MLAWASVQGCPPNDTDATIKILTASPDKRSMRSDPGSGLGGG